MYINNLGTVTRSLAPKHALPADVAMSQASLVSLLSIFNCLGRIVTGSLSDYAVHRAPNRWRFSRVWWNGARKVVASAFDGADLPSTTVSTASLYVISQILASSATSVHGWHGLVAPTILTGFGALSRVHRPRLTRYMHTASLMDHYSAFRAFSCSSASASRSLAATTACSLSRPPSSVRRRRRRPASAHSSSLT